MRIAAYSLCASMLAIAAPARAVTVCPGPDSVYGIDVSEFQGNIDWNAVKASGQQFAIIRVSDGTGHLDPYFDANWQGAKAAGLIRGVYQFFEPSEDPVAQANLLLQHMGALGPGDLPPMIDVEVTDGLGPAAITSAIHQWIDTVEAQTQRKSLIYTGGWFWNPDVQSGDFTSWPLVDSYYCSNCCPNIASPWTRWTMWQFSSTGSVSGIAGNVDLDRFDGTMADLMALAGGTTQPPPPTTQFGPIDLDGDGKTDRLIVDKGAGNWFAICTSGSCPIPWGWNWAGEGASLDVVLADFDGDGKTDRVLVNRATGEWFTLCSQAGQGCPGVAPFGGAWPWQWTGEGASHDLAVGDYDGDGKADPAIVDRGAGNWFVICSSGSCPIPWGWNWSGESSALDLATADYDGDGKTDRAIVNRATGEWFVICSTTGNGCPGVGPFNGAWPWQWQGESSAHDLVVADYDGDGKDDPAIVDRAAGNWFVVCSSGNCPVPWGWNWTGESSAQDLAIGDYDGDGKADRAIVDRAAGNWFVVCSSGQCDIPWGWNWSGESSAQSVWSAVGTTHHRQACVPATACPAGDECGTAPDGCGGTIACGSCPQGAVCGALAANQCAIPTGDGSFALLSDGGPVLADGGVAGSSDGGTGARGDASNRTNQPNLSGGCSVARGGSDAGAWWMALALVGLALVRRRRP